MTVNVAFESIVIEPNESLTPDMNVAKSLYSGEFLKKIKEFPAPSQRGDEEIYSAS